VCAIAINVDNENWFADVRNMDWQRVHSFLKQLFSTRYIVGHNLAFDLMFIREHYQVPYPAGDRIWDTMIAEAIITAGYKDEEVGLDDVVMRYLDVTMDKTYQTSFEYNDTPFSQEQKNYAVTDVALLGDIMDQQYVELSMVKMLPIMEIEMGALPVFAEMQRTGVLIDRDAYDHFLYQVNEQCDTLELELIETLTPYIWNMRQAEFDANQAELDDWNARLEAEVKKLEEFWTGFVNVFPENQEGFELPQSWIAAKWNDQKINKKDNKPEGMRRYVRHMVSKEWRPENKRPVKPKLDTSFINLNSGDQMIEAFKELGITLENYRSATLATALVATTDESLRQIIQSLLSYKGLEKFRTAFGENLVRRIGSDGRLRGNFRQIGTDTGRPSCSSPNMLQMPKRGKNAAFRKVFIPGDDMLFVRADYSQMELRIVAELSGDKAMQKAFKEGHDLHTYTAHLMFKYPLEKVTSEQRATAKTINFGILYGMGPTKLRATLAVDGINLTKSDAYEAIDLWKKTYHKAAALIQQWGDEATTRGWTETAMGRRRYFNLAFEEEKHRYAARREGANHPIQGSNADITKLAMVLIEDAIGDNGTVVLNIYDEVLVECNRSHAWWIRDVVESCMVIAAEEVLKIVPAIVEAQVTTSWSEKDALPDPRVQSVTA
jgi:DNA polymerase I-like protein with 3'-5' exonuclease and polymerase domains